MSQNKSGIKIVETDDKLYIKAGEAFAEKASYTKEILQRLEMETIKKVSILLSPKSKNFQNTFFLIRNKIIEERLENAQILLTSQSGPCFKQRVDENGNLCLTTRHYSLHSTLDKGNLSIHFSRGGKIYANEEVGKEIISIINLEKPQKVSILFVRADNEKHEAYAKRIKNLQHYFIREAVELYSVKQFDFLVATKDKPMLISSYSRPEGSFALICSEEKQMPVKHFKHKRNIDAVYEDCYSKVIG